MGSTSNMCADWTSSAGVGLVGSAQGADSSWTDHAGGKPCSETRLIYCFEED